MKRKVIFFIRAYNGLDHFTPIIYKFLETTEHDVVAILSTTNLDPDYTTTAYFFPGSELRCRDDLFHQLKNSLENPDYRTYSDSERESSIHQLIHFPDRNGLSWYVEYINDKLEIPATS